MKTSIWIERSRICSRTQFKAQPKQRQTPPGGRTCQVKSRHSPTSRLFYHKNRPQAQVAIVNHDSSNQRPRCKTETTFKEDYKKMTGIFVTHKEKPFPVTASEARRDNGFTLLSVETKMRSNALSPSIRKGQLTPL